MLTKNYGKKKTEIDDNPFAVLSKLMNPPKKKSSKKPKIAVIYAVGGITSGKSGGGLFGGESMGSVTMIEAIQEAEKDETVKAIVLRVDSPGGSAFASDMIWHEFEEIEKADHCEYGRHRSERRLLHQHGLSKGLCRTGNLDRLHRCGGRQDRFGRSDGMGRS